MSIPNDLQGLIEPCSCRRARELAAELTEFISPTSFRLAGAPQLPLRIECDICKGRGTLLTPNGKLLLDHLATQ